jgi:hypothetical protein
MAKVDGDSGVEPYNWLDLLKVCQNGTGNAEANENGTQESHYDKHNYNFTDFRYRSRSETD